MIFISLFYFCIPLSLQAGSHWAGVRKWLNKRMRRKRCGTLSDCGIYLKLQSTWPLCVSHSPSRPVCLITCCSLTLHPQQVETGSTLNVNKPSGSLSSVLTCCLTLIILLSFPFSLPPPASPVSLSSLPIPLLSGVCDAQSMQYRYSAMYFYF